CCSTFLSNLLIEMYGKCGRVKEAVAIFQGIHKPNVFSANMMIKTYAENGHLELARGVFDSTEEKDLGSNPDELSFIPLLSVLAHTGKIEQSCRSFASLTSDHNLAPTREHFSCAIDILGRSGQLQEAENLLRGMPFRPDPVAWATILGAGAVQSDSPASARAARNLFDISP
ncbi:hypothetical protein SELMODRAFT_72328, partial [Selaginella moellendorffii]